MVKNQLTKEIIQTGKKLVEYLLKSELEITAAFWLYFEEPEKWRLVIATPAAKEQGPRFAYQKIQEVLQNHQEQLQELTLSDVSAVKPDNQTAHLLRKAVGPVREVSGIHLPETGVDAHYIDETYVYYLV